MPLPAIQPVKQSRQKFAVASQKVQFIDLRNGVATAESGSKLTKGETRYAISSSRTGFLSEKKAGNATGF